MAKVCEIKDAQLKSAGHTRWLFLCPGCEQHHYFEVPGWTFDGNVDRPTVFPSILVKRGHGNLQCHSFIKGGLIRFLGDCDHELKGQVVELPDVFEDSTCQN